MATTTQHFLQESPRVIFTGDNLPVLRGMNSDSVDLIYLDPPFNSGKQWANPVEAAGRRAMAEFKDTWETSDIHIDERYVLGLEYPAAVDAIDALAAVNGDSWKAYLIYMGARLVEMRRILKPHGSIYYHCDPTMSHGVKLLMDAIFGGENFRNEIVWGYRTGGSSKKWFGRKHDIILFYSRSHQWRFNPQPEKSYTKSKNRKPGIVNYGGGNAEFFKDEGGIYNIVNMRDIWDIPYIGSTDKERTGYPTQKPLALLERIIKASSNEGDIVLDPFCGCATTCLAAGRLGRHWIGVDLSEQAASLVVGRLRKENDRTLVSAANEVWHIRKAPQRTDLPKRTKDGVLKPILHRRQGGKCEGCERKVEADLMDFDHIIAKSRGGQDIDDNLQLLCRTCNVWKGDKGMDALHKKVLHKRHEDEMQKYREKRER
ncbi:MAG: DNA methyltransferase, partial [Gammaproteobacteria bacterium]